MVDGQSDDARTLLPPVNARAVGDEKRLLVGWPRPQEAERPLESAKGESAGGIGGGDDLRSNPPPPLPRWEIRIYRMWR